MSQRAQICSQMEGLRVGVSSMIHDVDSSCEDNGAYGATQQSANVPIKGSKEISVKFMSLVEHSVSTGESLSHRTNKQ